MAIERSGATAATITRASRTLAVLLSLSIAGNLAQYLARRYYSKFHNAIDSKSGAFTFDSWRGNAEREFSRAFRRPQAIGILMIDIDNMRLVNDSLGHLKGDDILASVAEVIRASVREVDMVGRFGGDEFVVLLPGADREACHAVAERIHWSIRHPTAAMAQSTLKRHPVTVSIGCAMFSVDGSSLKDVLECADRALYDAKRSGRNQTICARRRG